MCLWLEVVLVTHLVTHVVTLRPLAFARLVGRVAVLFGPLGIGRFVTFMCKRLRLGVSGKRSYALLAADRESRLRPPRACDLRFRRWSGRRESNAHDQLGRSVALDGHEQG
jgi:hypothetical protein